MAATNPLRVTYAASATGAQTALSVDWRDEAPSGYSYEVQFDAGATGSVTIETTLDDINNPAITPDWVAETAAITADVRGVIGHPVVAVRINIGSLAGGTLTFKLLGGSVIGDTSGTTTPGGGAGSDVNVAEFGGTAVTLGQKAMAASMPVVIASNQSAVPVAGAATPADNFANPTTALPVLALGGIWDGATWDLLRSVAAAANTQGVGALATGMPLWSTADVTQTRINVAASGDTALVAAVASQTTRVYALRLNVAGAVIVQIKTGATVREVFNFAANGGALVLDLRDRPYYKTAANEALNINLSAAVQVDGVIEYVTSA